MSWIGLKKPMPWMDAIEIQKNLSASFLSLRKEKRKV
jgi:hypothetical protein